MSEQEDIKNFTVAFFTNLKSNLFWDNNGKKLTITSVPESFEKFYGKKAPYELVFSQKDLTLNEEPMIKGSFLLNCMKEYLSDKGQATLIKLQFDNEIKEELKKYIRLKNSEVSSISKKVDYDWLILFTFLTNLQYLNEKEQIINKITIKKDKLVNFDLDKYQTIEGKKEEINIGDIKSQYALAKEYLKELIKPKIQEITLTLNAKLEKEIQRIKKHYENQLNEDTENRKKIEEQLKELKEQEKKYLLEEIQKSKIKKMQENLELLNTADKKEKILKEEAFFIQDESHKHSLNIENKMLNTTIVYYPVYNLGICLKNNTATRIFDIKFNPLTKEISNINCESCNKDIKEVSLCTSGHLSCSGCLRACLECQNEYCNKCLGNSCFSCGKKLCKKCSKKCSSCGKIKCKNHMHSSSICKTCSEKKSKPSLINFSVN
jgi:hypothetical protein